MRHDRHLERDTPSARAPCERGAAIALLVALSACRPHAPDGAANAGTIGSSAGSDAETSTASSGDAATITDPGAPFVVERHASYFGVDDSRLIVRRDDASVDLIDSPQDSTLSTDGAPIGRYRATLPRTLVASIGTLLGPLLAPMPVPPNHRSPGDPPVMDAPSWEVTVERGGVKVPLRAPRTHDVTKELLDLLDQATAEAMQHPYEVLRVDVAMGAAGPELRIVSVGSAPVTFADPLARPAEQTGLFLWTWTDADMITKKPIALRETRRASALVTLRPGERLVLHAASKSEASRGASPHGGIVAQWSDPGQPEVDGGSYRVRGFAQSKLFFLDDAGEPNSRFGERRQ